MCLGSPYIFAKTEKKEKPTILRDTDSWRVGKCGTADIPVYFALSILSLGRAAAVKNFRLGLKYLTADVLPNTMQAAKYTGG